MRFFTVLALSAATALAPAMVLADAAQPQAVPAADAQAATGASPAQQTAQANPAPVSAVPSSDSNSNQIVCRMGTPPTGSRLGATRECHTQREWDQRTAEAQKILQQTQSTGLMGQTAVLGGGGGK